jgi:hypothetical protein
MRIQEKIFVRHGFSRDINASLSSALAADAFAWAPNRQGLKPMYSNC